MSALLEESDPLSEAFTEFSSILDPGSFDLQLCDSEIFESDPAVSSLAGAELQLSNLDGSPVAEEAGPILGEEPMDAPKVPLRALAGLPQSILWMFAAPQPSRTSDSQADSDLNLSLLPIFVHPTSAPSSRFKRGEKPSSWALTGGNTRISEGTWVEFSHDDENSEIFEGYSNSFSGRVTSPCALRRKFIKF